MKKKTNWNEIPGKNNGKKSKDPCKFKRKKDSTNAHYLKGNLFR